MIADRRIGELWAVNCHGMLFSKAAPKLVTARRVYSAFNGRVEVAFENDSIDYPRDATLSIGRGINATVVLRRVSRNGRAHYRVVVPSNRWLAFVGSITRRNLEGDTTIYEHHHDSLYRTVNVRMLQPRRAERSRNAA
jgi:hypothetical protein